MADISKRKQEKSTDDTPFGVPLKDRDGEPYVGKTGQPVKWFVLGEYSKAHRDFQRAQTNKVIKRARQGRDEFDYDDSEQAAIDRIFAVSTGWENMEDEGGEPIPFNKVNAAAVLQDAEWIADQLQKAIKGHRDFFKRASAN